MTRTPARAAQMLYGRFRPVLTDGQWELRLAGRDAASDPLVISGGRLGPDPWLGSDELEHAIVRLLAPATRWLIDGWPPPSHDDRAAPLFRVIAEAWSARREPVWSCGPLRLYRVTLPHPVGVRYWEPTRPQTDRLDLVVWHDGRDRLLLLNVYPAGPDPSARGWPRLPTALRSVVAVRDSGRLIGTGVVVDSAAVLTARHVVIGRPVSRLSVDRGSRVAEVMTVPLTDFGADADHAARSCEHARRLSGTNQPTVDLALLAVPELVATTGRLRERQLRPGEHIAVAGFPRGRWTVAVGPITSVAGADLRAHLIAGPGTSGGPAIDHNGEIAGILTMGHPLHGELFVGPRLLRSFLAALHNSTGPVGADV